MQDQAAVSLLDLRAVSVGVLLSIAAIGAAAVPPQKQSEYVISGRVEDPHDLDPEDAILMIGASRAPGSFSRRPVAVAHDGSFTTLAVRPDTYVIEVVRTPHSSIKPATTVGLTMVSVASADVSGVSVVIRPDAALAGRYRMVSDNPAARWPPHIHVNAMLIGPEGQFLGSQISEGAQGGRFILRNAYGPRILRTGYTSAPGEFWSPSHVFLDGRDITNVPTDFSRLEDATLEVTFTQHPSRIQGMVVHPDGRPAVGAWVFVAAPDPETWHSWASTSHVVQADAKGAFSLITLPGRYVARAFPPHKLLSSRRAKDHISEIGHGAAPFELGTREQKKIVLTVEPSGGTTER
jgi:hypothetical protein